MLRIFFSRLETVDCAVERAPRAAVRAADSPVEPESEVRLARRPFSTRKVRAFDRRAEMVVWAEGGR